MNYLILSDIHGNLSALQAVLDDCKEDSFAGVILLGDLIDYGMRSNEVLALLKEKMQGEWKDKILANIWGNHEKLAIDQELDRLSADRGRVMAAYTRKHLSEASLDFIEKEMNRDGIDTFEIDGRKCLSVHGSLMDPYWKGIMTDDLRGDYAEYDIVFSGHSHYPHSFAHFYPIEDEQRRNKKAVLFINPGSVGQPRNQNPNAQYAILRIPSGQVELRAVAYDIALEQSLFPDEVDAFYKKRLAIGV